MLKTLHTSILLLAQLVACNSIQANLPSKNLLIHTIKSGTQEGFISGTEIKTPNGYTNIENLKENDLVLSYNLKDRKIQEDSLCKICKHRFDRYIEIHINQEVLKAGPAQKFYCLRKENEVWVEAQNLTTDDCIYVEQNTWERIHSLVEVKENIQAYSLSTLQQHNFFVSRQSFLTHNVVFILGAVAAFEVILEITAPAIVFSAMYLYCKMSGKKLFFPFTIHPPNDNDWKHIMNNNRHDHGFNGKDPKKIWDCAQAILMGAISKDEIRDNAKYIISGLTEYGVMEIKGVTLDGIVRIGTMYIKGQSCLR